jgi:HEAT repeat protein
MQPHLATEDRRRRCNAAFVLAGLGDEQGVEILIAELRDTEPGSRVIEGLPRPVGLATSNLSGVGRQQVRMDRYFAALLLGELRAEAAVPALIEATRDESINYRAATSLGEIGDARAIPALREMVAAFPEQRVFAGYGLAALGVAEGFAILDDVAVSHEQWTQRRYAVDLLGKTMDPRSTPILLRSLRDEHANVRVSAVRSLAAVGDPAALITLRVALDDYEVTPVNERTTVAAEAEKAIAAIESKNPDVRGQR